jgi:hypothetical protein
MSKVRNHAEARLRTYLRQRHMLRKSGYVRFPCRDLYERHELYKPSTEAGWKSAHAPAGRTLESRVREHRMQGGQA